VSAIKPPHKRINRITNGIGTVSTIGKAPRMPRGLCDRAQTAWKAYWSGPAAAAAEEVDHEVALRWIADLNRYLSLINTADAKPMVVGSTGQLRANPLYEVALKVQAAVNAAERRLGIGVLDRLHLGLAFTEGAKSLAELNREAITNAEDPRAALGLVADIGPETA
jgi:hypothetical protein